MGAATSKYASDSTARTNTGAGSDTYTDVPSSTCTLADADFEDGKKYLIIATGLLSGNNANGNFGLRLVHGTTAFDGATLEREPNTTTAWCTFGCMRVWTAVAGEGIKFQCRTVTTTHTVSVDQLSIFAIKLSDDFTENTDWFYNENTTDTTLTSTFSTTNNPTITFTPGTADQAWLVLACGQLDPLSLTISYKSRLRRQSNAVEQSVLPELSLEPDDANDLFLFLLARVFTLPALEQIFEQQAAVSTTGTTETRTFGAVFAINLAKFRQATHVYSDTETDLSATAFATELHSLSLTPEVAGDVLVLGTWGCDHAGGTSGIYNKGRIQVDNADLIGNETTDSYQQEDDNDTRDDTPFAYVGRKNLNTDPHTFDMDASVETASAGIEQAVGRSLVVVTMELPAAGGGGGGTPMHYFRRRRAA
jgi:hypothetical protein